MSAGRAGQMRKIIIMICLGLFLTARNWILYDRPSRFANEFNSSAWTSYIVHAGDAPPTKAITSMWSICAHQCAIIEAELDYRHANVR